MDFRKMEEQELKFHLRPGDLVTALKEATDAFKDIAERKRIRLNFSTEVNTLCSLNSSITQ